MSRLMGRLACTVALLASLGGAASAQVPDDAALCRDGIGDLAVDACTHVISPGQIAGRELAEVLNHRGVAYDGKGDLDHAIADFTEAIRLDPAFTAAWNNRGLTLRRAHELDRAIADHSEAIRLDPKFAVAYVNRAVVFNDRNAFDRAIADLDQALLLNARMPAAYANRGVAYRGKGNYDRAIADFDAALRISPKNPNWLANRGIAYKLKDDLDHAIADFDEAIRLDVKYALAYRERGTAFAGKDELDLAIANFSVAIKLNPTYTAAYVDRGLAYVYSDDYEHALADADEALRLTPNSAPAHNLRGFAYLQKGDLDRAKPDLDDAIRLAPTTLPRAYVNRGDYYRRKGDLDRAIADLDEAIHLDPQMAAAYTQRGLAYERKGDVARARADFNAAVAHPQSRSIAAKGAVELARARLAMLAGVAAAPVAPGVALGEKRVALVIGNAGYRFAAALPNAARDAAAIAAALQQVGFQTVTLENDLGKDRLADALRTFSHLAEGADWALIYYAGHGIEVAGTNYLVPVDARLETDRDVQFETVSLEQVIAATEGARKLRVILLDACRENPFARQMRRTVAARAIGRGLASVEPDGGTLVAYAAKHGEVALDGANGNDSGNSPFVTALVRHLATPGIEINKLFRLVRDDVLKATARRQEPFVYGSLPGEDFYFMPPR